MGERSTAVPKGIVAHQHFRDALADARFDGYRADPRTRVRDAAEFERMRAHVQALHENVDVQHSFVDASGQVFDCVPIHQQPSLRGHKVALAEPRSLADLTGAKAAPAVAARVAPSSAQIDRHGNAMDCPPGCIPARRITLAELARFRTLEDWRSKGPAKSTQSIPDVPSAEIAANHRYAYVQQDVDNLGAHNFLNVWSPSVTANQIFSLAQHWYSAGVDNAHQTLEVGWQVYPTKYGHSQPVLFIFWTNDNYQTSKVYNLEGPGFVQTNPAWRIGGSISPTSADGSLQYEVEVAVYQYQSNWWLYLGGLVVENAVGYFPTSIYTGGAMASNAAQILFGGETVCEQAGTWPAMGSGALASAGWTHAAYHRDIFYFPTSGGAQYASLLGHSPSPGCYTQQVSKALAPWNIYFFYGGPGGGDC
jgi:hypothetical protein